MLTLLDIPFGSQTACLPEHHVEIVLPDVALKAPACSAAGTPLSQGTPITDLSAGLVFVMLALLVEVAFSKSLTRRAKKSVRTGVIGEDLFPIDPLLPS